MTFRSDFPTSEEAMQYIMDAQLNGRIDFVGKWNGWKLRDRDLVSPDGQRISPRRLEGLLWRDAMELRLAGFASRKQAESAKQVVRVVVVRLQDYRQHGIAAA